MDPELSLEGLFLYLVRRGFPLTFRDYQDALRALSTGRGLLTRERLLWLLETLWTKTDEEKRRLHLLFRDFPFPGEEEIAAWTGEEEPEDDTTDQKATEETGDTTESEETKVPQIQFTAPGQSGLGLPRAQVVPDGSERFVLQSRPQVSLRSLIVTWRRFRRASRTGPKTELDLAATIAEQCRRGALIHPVFVPTRRNQARLIVLVDASPSMAPWRSMNRLLAESLRESRLGLGALYYFHNVPDRLFEAETLTRPVSLAAAFELHGASTLLVVSDAGAARGRRTRGRITATKTLLEKIAGRWQPVAWANPMPPKRWPGTSAERIARFQGLAMSELTEDGLTQAIDILRGQRSA